MNGAPPQSAGYVSDSGWTDSELFVKWLDHFVSITNASTNAQHPIIIDGHQTQAAINFARRHGIRLLTLPPHSTHKLQPLDRTFSRHLKVPTMPKPTVGWFQTLEESHSMTLLGSPAKPFSERRLQTRQ